MCPENLKKTLKLTAPPAFWLGVWQFAAMAAGQELLLPYPLTVFQMLLTLARTGEFWLAVFSTLGRILGGLAAGCALGVLCAVLAHRFAWARLLLSPMIRIVQATPVVCFILLVYLWVARTRIPEAISALMVLPVVWGNVDEGLRSVDRQLLEMGQAYRFSSWKMLRLIYLPSLKPYFTSALLTATGLAWKSGVAAEVLCPPKLAVGAAITRAKTALETPELFAWTLTIIILSLALEGLFKRILAGKRGKS